MTTKTTATVFDCNDDDTIDRKEDGDEDKGEGDNNYKHNNNNNNNNILIIGNVNNFLNELKNPRPSLTTTA